MTEQERSPTEVVAIAIHRGAGRLESGERPVPCQADDEWTFHWPCWHLATALARVVDEAGWRTSPTEHFNSGRRYGATEALWQVKGSMFMPDLERPQPGLEVVYERVERWWSRARRGVWPFWQP